MKSITIAPVEAKHEKLILSWLDKPHVKEWFHGEGLINTIEGLKRFINNDNPRSDLWLAYYEGGPFAYLITSTIDEAAENNTKSHLSKWVEPGKQMSTLDLLIGEEKYLGKGLATKLIQEFIKTQLSDSHIIFIDPECSNKKAIHVYEKAGFEKIDEFIAAWHPVPHLLMRLRVR
jgi:RimJ/RimL family protein N-acetyltransferase